MKREFLKSLQIVGVLLTLFSVYFDNLHGQSANGLGYVQLAGIVAGIVLFLAAFIMQYQNHLKEILFLPFLLGVILLSINTYGLLIPLRNNDINKGVLFYDGILRIPREDYGKVGEELERYVDEPVEEYAQRLTKLIYSSTVHYWGDNKDDNNRFHILLPFYENYLLYISKLDKQFQEQPVKLCSPYKAIERGVGYCGQMAQILVSVWDQKEKTAHMITLDGHIVVEVQINPGKWWILDPDFGVVIDRDLKTIEANPMIAYSYYSNAGFSEKTSMEMAYYYLKDGNYRITNVGPCNEQREFDIYIWIIPIALMSPFIVFLLIKSISQKISYIK